MTARATGGSTAPGILSGAGAPGNGTGSDGGFYVDTTNSRLYGPKASGAWPATYSSLNSSYRGRWAISTAYNASEMVSYAGVLYAAKTTFTSGSSFDPQNWTLVDQIASRASNGFANTGLIPVAYRAWVAQPNVSDGVNFSETSMISHKVLVQADNIALRYSNVDAHPEGAGSTTTMTIKAAIKVGGTVYPLTFRGSRTTSLDPGRDVISDPVGIRVNAGDTILSRNYCSVPSGTFPRHHIVRSARGEATNWAGYGGSGADLTATGSADPTGGTDALAWGPTGVLGLPTTPQPVVGLVGDSIMVPSSFDTGGGSPWLHENAGFCARALYAGNVPFIHLAKGGECAAFWAITDQFLHRRPNIPGITHAIVEYGVNDTIIARTDSLATVQANLRAVWAGLRAMGAQKVYQTTITPTTTSTDSWATLVNQSTQTGESVRTQVNDWIRTTPTGIDGYFEVADTVESARNSGKWKVNGSAGYLVGDGTHPNGTGHALMAAAINPAVFTL